MIAIPGTNKIDIIAIPGTDSTEHFVVKATGRALPNP